jgi:dTDP-4-amino-4,6-dideoxygalactose transaminase
MINCTIPFHIPHTSGKELQNITALIEKNSYSSNGAFTTLCEEKIAEQMDAEDCLLTSSGTHALEMAALLLDIGEGDEVIIPAYTHYSTANAFLLHGAKVVCVDIDPDTLNIDPKKAAAAVTPHTRAIIPIHYGGTSADMGKLQAIANSHAISIIEDAALSYGSFYNGKKLGTLGTVGCLSFHSAKVLTSGGEGGAILLNRKGLHTKAEILQGMGTDRAAYFRNSIPEYTWRGVGSSYLISELSAAFLSAQLDAAAETMKKRVALWNLYHENLADLEKSGCIKRAVNPNFSEHNAHTYYIRTFQQSELRAYLGQKGIETSTHYKVLPETPFGKSCSNIIVPEPVVHAVETSETLLRLPLYPDLTHVSAETVCSEIINFFGLSKGANR